MRLRAPAIFLAFNNRQFLLLWTGTFLAFVAFLMASIVQSVLAFELAGNNSTVGLVIFGQGIAQLILGPLGGVLADRHQKKRIVIACQVIIGAVLLAFALLVLADRMEIVFLAIGAFVTGSAFSFLGPARQAWMVELVESAMKANASALTQVALSVARIGGPLIASVFFAVKLLNAGWAFALAALLFAAAVAVTLIVPATGGIGAAPASSVWRDVASGMGYVVQTRNVRHIVLSGALVVTLGGSYVVVLPGLLENQFHRDASDVPLLFGVSATGALLGSLIAAGLSGSPRAGIAYSALCWLFGAALIGSGLAPTYVVLVFLSAVVGLSATGFQTLNAAIIARNTLPEYFGRVISIAFLGYALSSAFSLPFGLLADAGGERLTLQATGLGICAVVGAFWLTDRPWPRDRSP